MTDRELLELAAKAAGYDPSHPWNAARMTFDPPVIGLAIDGVSTNWNPLENDSDALRLAVKLRLDLHYEDQPSWVGEIVEVLSQRDEMGACHCETVALEDDPFAATRRAIVRAAAATQQHTPESQEGEA